MNESLQVLRRLANVIDQRYRQRPPDSYTTLLFNSGPENIVAKFSEEAAELVEAAREEKGPQGAGRAERVRDEAADVLFHLLVLLRDAQVPLDDVCQELVRREGQSGLTPPPPSDPS
ncbi:MAG: phosphoribosyl-ATP diphosphatase [Planctomycetales bacterium]|nr:phosphoribosyl-ATP diphosphatase [Planctomycetales bacterium]NIP70767.1 phosphoribosyl-ATP diphosphatase [Planctomycetales bacterium]